jgi:peptidyl-prolyl cis-trans isomerase C
MVQRNLLCILFVCVVLCFTVAAQEKTPPAAPPAPAASPTPATASAPAQAPAAADAGSDLVVAKVFGEPISEKVVLSAINLLSGQKRLPQNLEQGRALTLFQGAMDNLIITAAIKNQAKVQNIPPDQTFVDQQMQIFTKKYPSAEEFQKVLAAQNLTEAELRKRVEDNSRMQQLLELATKTLPPVTEEEIQKFYSSNPQNFAMPEQVHAEHILLLVDKKGTAEQTAEIRKKIEEIRADIESGKITFEDAAKQFSQDKSNAPKGGDLGFFSRGRMVKPFEDAVFALQDGALSPIVETSFGFHIIKMIERKPAGTVSLEEAKPRIKEYLDQSNKRKATQLYVNDLKSKATVETFMTAEEFLKRHPEVK